MMAAAPHAALLPGVSNRDAVGRAGHLELTFVRNGRRTVLTHSSCTTPWHFMPPSYPDEQGYAYTLLVNPSGGLVGGDELSVRAEVGTGGHVLISTPSANRLYRSAGEVARQHIRLKVEAGAILEWLPDLAIPYAGARFHQTIEVEAATGATVVLWDAMASGRIARGERWRFDELHNDIRVTTTGGAAVIERYTLTPCGSENGFGHVEAWDYVGSFIVVGDRLESERLDLVADRLYALADRDPGELIAGISAPAVRGLVIKVVAKSAPVLSRFFDAAWLLLRRELLGLPEAALRRY